MVCKYKGECDTNCIVWKIRIVNEYVGEGSIYNLSWHLLVCGYEHVRIALLGDASD